MFVKKLRFLNLKNEFKIFLKYVYMYKEDLQISEKNIHVPKDRNNHCTKEKNN